MTFKMIQAPRQIVLLTELNSPARQIYTDGRPLPKDPEPSWMGYSVGKWEGDTLRGIAGLDSLLIWEK